MNIYLPGKTKPQMFKINKYFLLYVSVTQYSSVTVYKKYISLKFS